MNAPLASNFLAPVAVDLVARVPLMPEETTFSYVNRLACLTATNRRQIVSMLFGSQMIRPDRPLHGGYGHFFAHCYNDDDVQPTDLPMRHGLIALFGPFADTERYCRAVKLLHGKRGNGIHEVVGLRSPAIFRDHPAFCYECIADDFLHDRPAHYRRVDQVSAVTLCPIHGVPLITKCGACGAPISHELQPALLCHHCGVPFKSENVCGELDRNAVQWRLSQFIQAALQGKLPNIEAEFRLKVLRERASRVIRNRSNVIGDNLSRAITHAYGKSFLKLQGLPTDSAPTLAWPSLLIQGRHLVSDPIANCLVLAVLFDSVDDYVCSVADYLRLCSATTFTQNKALIGVSSITMAVLKDVLRPLKLEEIAKKHGINGTTLKTWVAAVPGLSERRLVSGRRVTARKHKMCIVQHIKKHPNQSRSQVATEYGAAIAYLLRNDRAWLDQHLPTKAGLAGAVCRPTVGKDFESDEVLSSRLRAAIADEKAALARPKRLTPDRVVRMSGLSNLADASRSHFPQTMAAISECSETVGEYYKRALVWAARDLKRCYGACAGLIQLFVHARVGVEYVGRLESYGETLLMPKVD